MATLARVDCALQKNFEAEHPDVEIKYQRTWPSPHFA